MNKKKFIAILTLITISVAFGGYLSLRNGETTIDTKPLDISFSEQFIPQDELIKEADLITRCKVKEIKTETKTAVTKAPEGNEYSITAQVTTYRLKPIESLKVSKADADIINLSLIGSEDRFINTEDEYVVFLKKNPSDDNYTLISYNQGLKKIVKSKSDENSAIEFEQLITPLSKNNIDNYFDIGYKTLKEKIIELQ